MGGSGTTGGIMVIGDVPTFFEDDEGEYFVGSTSKMFIRELYNVGIDLTECYVTKAIKCYHASKKPAKATLRNCREILKQEIAEVKPKFILLLGNTALEVLLGLTNMQKYRGKLFDYDGIKVVATVNPHVVIKQPSQTWEFRADLNYFSRLVDGWSIPDDFVYQVWEPLHGLSKIRCDIEASDAISYDIETTGLDEYEPDGKILMIGISTRVKCYILPVNDFTIPFLNSVLGDGVPWEKVAHNAKFDNRWLRKAGVFPVVTFDTFLAAYLLNVTTPHGLKYLAKTFLGAIDYDEGIEFKADLSTEEFQRMAKYCALDVYYTLKLYDFTRKELQEDKKLWRVFKYIVMPGERILQDIENNGVWIDGEKLKQVTTDYEMNRDIMDEKIEEILPKKWKGKINLNSTKQLGELLFKDLKLPVIDKTSTGEPSTGKSTLLRLVDKHPLPGMILERRKYEKALVGFLVPWAEFLKRDGRLHSTYKIAETATGRLSAENPNLQQVPRDPNVRSLVGAPEGRVFIEADYSQIELRTAAFVAGAESMKDAYRKGEDLHAKTAASVSHVKPEEVTKPQRTAAKAVNFGFLYGMWWKSFKAYAFDSYGVVVTDKEAEHARNAYFDTYPELLRWHEKQKEYVRKHKCVRTYTGRIRHLPDIDSPDKDMRGSAERQAINTVVQSFASDMTLLAMILIDKNIKKKYSGRAMLVGQVHDAIMVEADEEIGREVALMVKRCMESVPLVLEKYFGVVLDLPIVAEVEMGPRWGIAEIIE
jgi:DNA polymerase-1